MMTQGTEREFRSAAGLLEHLWFVEPQWLDEKTRGIDWDAIEAAEKGVAASDGELILLQAARMLWLGSEAPHLLVRAMRVLDDKLWAAFLEAVQIKRPVTA